MGNVGPVFYEGLVFGVTCVCIPVEGGGFSCLCWAGLCEVVILYSDDFVCVFVCCLSEASCTGCCWQLGDARSCTQVEAFVRVLTN